MALGLRIFFQVIDTSGVLVAGLDLSASGTIKISVNGASIANRLGGAPVEIGDGAYYYDCDASEIPTSGTVLLFTNLNPASYQPQWWRAEVGLLGFAYRTGRTVLGLFRRLGATLEGAADGLDGNTPRFFQPDGTTVEFQSTQDVVAGTRGTATVTNSEIP